MRLTSKGQVTVPKAIREKLRIGPGSEVDFIFDGQSARLVTIEEPRIFDAKAFDEWASKFAGTVDLNGLDTDAYMIALRGARDDGDAR